MKLPNNYTEEEVLAIIADISKKLSFKFKFGYHAREDMEQQASLFAWEGLEKYDGRKPLENFLWVHVRNRLFNFKRNNFGRPNKPCDNCPLNAYVNNRCTAFTNLRNCEHYEKWYLRNSAKQNLLSSKEYIDNKEPSENDPGELISNRELINLIEQRIPHDIRKDWVKLKNNIKITKRRRLQILEIIEEIMNEDKNE